MKGIRWLIAAMVCVSAQAQSPPPRPAPPQTPAARAEAPDDEFLEFLGSDDVGDADWEFLKSRQPVRRAGYTPPPPPPPQDEKR
jgi:hypothetical protein